MVNLSNLKEVVLPTGNFFTGTKAYSLCANAINLLPKDNADFTTRSWMAVAGFIGGFATQTLSLFAAFWDAYGVFVNTFLFLVAEATEKEQLLGQHKITYENNIKACLIQGLFHFTISYLAPWWLLGLFNAFQCYSSRIGIKNILDSLHDKVTTYAESVQEHSSFWNLFGPKY